MAEPRTPRSALTREGVTRYIEVKGFFWQGFVSMGDIGIIKTVYQILLTFKYIRSGGLINPGNITFSITASFSIQDFWFWINNCCKRKKYQTGGDINWYQKDEFYDIYRDAQDHADEKHKNEWIIPKW